MRGKWIAITIYPGGGQSSRGARYDNNPARRELDKHYEMTLVLPHLVVRTARLSGVVQIFVRND